MSSVEKLIGSVCLQNKLYRGEGSSDEGTLDRRVKEIRSVSLADSMMMELHKGKVKERESQQGKGREGEAKGEGEATDGEKGRQVNCQRMM